MSDKLKKQRRVDRIFAVLALLTIAAAWFIGLGVSKIDYEKYLSQTIPDAERFVEGEDGTFTAYKRIGDAEEVIGFLAIGEADGYGGPMIVLASIDLTGEITGFTVVEQRETQTFLQRVLNSGLYNSLSSKNVTDELIIDNDVDAVSGATYSSKALVESLRRAGRNAAANLDILVPDEPKVSFQFGIKETSLLFLFLLGFIGHSRRFKYKKQIRLLSMISGMIILGFIYNSPLTIAKINTFILGYWPDWHTEIYWYLMFGGILFVYTADNRNPYCQWFCPFGSAQESVGMIGGVKVSPLNRLFFVWLQRSLAWTVIILALIFRNPGISGYEIFGVLFDLNGTTVMFILTGLILIASLFIHRPWCSYLCPVSPVTDLISLFRNWIKELWKRKSLA